MTPKRAQRTRRKHLALGANSAWVCVARSHTTRYTITTSPTQTLAQETANTWRKASHFRMWGFAFECFVAASQHAAAVARARPL